MTQDGDAAQRSSTIGADDSADVVDVAVVGYGPVGMVTAALLGAAGHRVVVLERYDGLYNLPRAAIFDDETMRTFARVGIAEALLPALHVQRNYEWRNAAGELLIEHHFAARGRSGWAEWYMMYQPDLEAALDERVRATGVEVRLGTPVTGLTDGVDGGGDHVELLTGGRRPDRVRARWVIACDGGNSFVREALGRTMDDYGFSEPWMVCDFRFRDPSAPPAVPTARQVGDPAGPTSIISLGPAHHRFSYMLDSVEDFGAERDPAKVWARTRRWLSPDDAELIRVATYTFRSLVTDRWRVGHVLLAGDAAHQMPPFLGQGMCSGIRDAQNIAFKLDAVLRGRLGDEVLDTYQQEREPHVRAVIEKGIELGRQQTVRDPARAAERDRVLLARRAAHQHPEEIRFPGLVEGLLATSSGPGRGELVAQGVVDDGARRDRLDQVVGHPAHLLLDARRVTLADDLLAVLADAGVRVVALHEAGTASPAAPDPGHVVDAEGTHLAWLAAHDAVAAAVRPDFYVFGTATDPGAADTLARELAAALGAPAPALLR
ncbi:bifunctional 3-(3-hydroxy-phenyl)propionate/3-hydroxycinnamic acid hydroxylase [Actinomycetospora lutea]|uniref:bifunctional 3-(3-hydroxy-phenyl)propionate/3-hydroxycinnamic acid hydroxylase n=1 Tax=Actinomycetospora lutea TaxID=663604 RepID=UPI0023670DD9|nr:bifunctional 3-(3-hydroxy-phenyl)propionate/3-hydroxycinnamic acid hydroxylase [Actinomycetospora lutea]MDD7938589.1 bifunctional 3-(3-hydroxy-phenyl)propionate/3-hydroxycinnamic acid hydroxylase [Actinomycetospora lutea]